MKATDVLTAAQLIVSRARCKSVIESAASPVVSFDIGMSSQKGYNTLKAVHIGTLHSQIKSAVAEKASADLVSIEAELAALGITDFDGADEQVYGDGDGEGE